MNVYDNLIAAMPHKRVLICGTGPSLQRLEDPALVAAIARTHCIFCVNTAHHFFTSVDILFIGPRCEYARTVRWQHFDGKRVMRFFVGADAAQVPGTRVPVVLRDDPRPLPVISTDITQPLPHGPTTILDLAVPTAMFCGMTEVCFIGAEYHRAQPYTRFGADATYRDGNSRIGFSGEMYRAHLSGNVSGTPCEYCVSGAMKSAAAHHP